MKPRSLTSHTAIFVCLLSSLTALWSLPLASATTYTANPSNYNALLDTLKPGDTLTLDAGRYTRLTIDGLNGTTAAPITITGPVSGQPAIIQAESSCCNTIQIYRSSYVVIKNLTVDGRWQGADGINAKDSTSHHITIENCLLHSLGTDQQTVGISTKSTAWGWVVRRTTILDAGTGIYFGSSDGSAPFIGGLIEGNLIKNPVGYAMQIKFQKSYALQSGMPPGPNKTIIRDNVFVKDDRPSPDGDRPNLLVGGFPTTGPGSSDYYEIYRNFFYNNPRENLLQASGRVVIHDNIFVRASDTSIFLANHDLPLKRAYIFNNTIYGGRRGIHFASSAPDGDAVVGNLIFSETGISGSVTNKTDNLIDSTQNAPTYVASPSNSLGTMNFYPLPGKCQGTPIDLSPFAAHGDYNFDFNRALKGSGKFRGAYAGEGTNTGWALTDQMKTYTSSGTTNDTTPPAAPTGVAVN